MHDLAGIAGEVLDRIRGRRPRVHCVTNSVAEAFTANVLLALGAVPSMTAHPDEVVAFVEGADGLLINLGTPDESRNEANRLATTVAMSKGLDWVMDPVFVDRSPVRLKRALGLLALEPAVVRGNAAELAALEQGDRECFAELCARSRTVVVSTGETDRVEGLGRVGHVDNGDRIMERVTAMGCATSAVVAAFCAVHDDRFEASVCGLLSIGVCGERAAADADGPGSFVPAFLDRLAGLDAAGLADAARCSERAAA